MTSGSLFSLCSKPLQGWRREIGLTDVLHAQTTGVWAQLQCTKELVCEPHGTGEAFDAAMKTYYDAIAEGRGAIFFAICRGKVRPD